MKLAKTPVSDPQVRGAARINIVWFISAIVGILVAALFAFVAYGDKATIQESLDAARTSEANADQRWSESQQKVREISEAIGWHDGTLIVSNVTAIQGDLDNLKATFPDMGDDVKTVQDALPRVTAAFNARGREISTLRDSVASLESEKSTQKQALDQTISQKDSEIADLRRQLTDATDTAAQRQTELENRIADLRSQNSELDGQLREQRTLVSETERQFRDERVTYETRLREQGSKLKFPEEPAVADGQILAASDDGLLAWIDRGAVDRLARGTKFSVVSGKVGDDRVKAWAEVTNVEADRAEVLLTDIADPFNPVIAGDVIFNPLYDPEGERNAVLVGRFSVPNENEVKLLLQNMGITVQEKLDLTTDYLVVGADLFVDPETGEPLEDPLQPSELDEYKNAESLGVQITPIKDLRSYFKF